MDDVFDLYAELAAIARVFHRRRIDYAICGGVAVSIHGFVRATDDIDFVMRDSHINRAMDALDEVGFILRAGAIPLPSQGITFYHTSKAKGENLLMVDMLPLPKDHPWLRNKKRVKWREGYLWVLDRNDLIEMKSTSTRSKDRLDIDEMGRQQTH